MIRWTAILLLAPVVAAQAGQVHLGLPSADPTTDLSVLWLEPAARPDAAVVLVGPDGERTIDAELVPGPSVGAAYEARLDGLEPGTNYTYRVGDRDFSFRTPPEAAGVVRFVALGDMGVTPRSQVTVDAIQALGPDFVLHAGDISYAQGDPVAWATWFEMVEPVAASIPWVTALGNHETYTGPSIVGGVQGTLAPSPAEIAFYRQRFGLPGNELWYSFDWAGVHVVGLSTYSRQPVEGGRIAPDPEPEQVEWLAGDLAAADAAWTIVFLHEPPYSSNDHGPSKRVQRVLVPLFEEHGVDLVIAAHDHAYERSYPMLGGAPLSALGPDFPAGAGVAYVVTGGGGQSLYDGWEEPAPAWSAARASIYHVTLVTVTPDSIGVQVVPTQGDEFTDGFRLVRPASEPSAGAGPGTDDTPVPPWIVLAAFFGAATARARRDP